MRIYAICPISDKKLNENEARINAAFTVILVAIFFLTSSIIPVAFLILDFLLRSTSWARCSILGNISKLLAIKLSIRVSFINAGPKIFAARLGLMMSSLIVILFLLNFHLPAYIFAGILGLFSLLEASIGLCIACEIYPYLYNWLYKE